MSAIPLSAQDYRRGVVLVVLGSACASWLGIGVRMVESASAWQILVYRSLALAIFLTAFLAIRHQGRLPSAFRGAGLAAFSGGLGLAAAFSGIILAIDNASVANAMFVLAVAPFVAAVLGRVILGERVRNATWAAIACAFAGVAVMVAEGVVLGFLWGNVAALVAALGYATFVVSLRRGRLTDMLPLGVIAGVLGVVIATTVCALSGQGLLVSAHDLIWSLAMGVFQLGLALILITSGSRSVPAADMSLFGMIEVVLAPFWVWLFLGETAGLLTLAGGALLLAAIAGDALTGMRAHRLAAARPGG
ncbi:MAG: EamA family transporter [Gammaproteobacteria bacterium]|nr:EamA family transporter [Gammaproteobacteria bacterium]NIM73130.1 EamA family transporter [Gammaproteobacteria bacterium]NIN38810.1 EamA family transporter [Gammaproteobacteria bacterium]NIO24885.1 EamA family transporter [Gammaproteobacteria bacterium]NIO65487.1 EamA family transporter [Gammaproteobacteria bacterium]